MVLCSLKLSTCAILVCQVGQLIVLTKDWDYVVLSLLVEANDSFSESLEAVDSTLIVPVVFGSLRIHVSDDNEKIVPLTLAPALNIVAEIS